MILSQGQSEADNSDHIFLAFASVLLTRMEEWIASQAVPVFYHSTTIFYEDSQLEEPDIPNVSWENLPIRQMTDYIDLIIQSSRDHIWASKEVQEYVTYWKPIIGMPLNTEVLPFFEKASAPLQAYMFLSGGELLAPILDVLEHANTFHPTREQLLDSFHRFRNERTNTSIYWDITAPLFNMISDIQHKETLGSFELSPFTVEEKTEVWNTFEIQSLDRREAIPINIVTFAHTGFQLTTTFTESRDVRHRTIVMGEVIGSHITRSKYIAPKLIEKVDELEDIVTALCLIHAGNVHSLVLIERLRTTFFQNKRGSIYMLHNRPMNLRTPQDSNWYTLHETDLSTMRICFDTLRRLRMQNGGKDKPHGQLSVAIRRFNESYNRELPEDRIIDLTIALESSLLAELRDELSYKLSLRGTALLALTRKWEPSKCQALLRAMYDIRSKIVHNGQLLSDLEKDVRKLQRFGIEPRDFAQWCEDIVRDVLKEYVLREAKGQSLKHVNEDLDKHIVESLRLQSHSG